MKVYLSGPMRGIPEFNFPQFHDATEWLRLQDHIVFNPAEHSYPTEDLRAAFSRDTEWLCGWADAVALLPGWHNSKGAKAECALALALGLEVYYLHEMPSREWYLTKAEDLG